jgi:hypothetical protein
MTMVSNLPANSITTWEELETTFLNQWGEKIDHQYYLTEFVYLKRKNDESVSDFTK